MSDISWALTEEKVSYAHSDDERLAHLLINYVVFLSGPEDGMLQPDQSEGVCIYVNVNDTFAYACADAERLSFNQLNHLYKAWRANPVWGSTAWAISVRKQEPIPPIVGRLSLEGYDLKELLAGRLATSDDLVSNEGQDA